MEANCISTKTSLQNSKSSMSSVTLERVRGSPTTGFWPGCQAPDFRDVPFLQGGAATTLTLSSLRGSAVLLLFLSDFGYIGPTELELVEQLGSNCRLVAVSTGSLVGQQAFLNTPRCPIHVEGLHSCRGEGGGQGLANTLVEDRGGAIARAFGVSGEGSSYRCLVTLLTDPSYRAMVLLDTRGEVVVRQVGDLPLGLGSGELARVVREQQVASTPMEEEEGGSELGDQVVGDHGVQAGEVFHGPRSGVSSHASGVLEATAVEEAVAAEGSSSGEQRVMRPFTMCTCPWDFAHTTFLHEYTKSE